MKTPSFLNTFPKALGRDLKARLSRKNPYAFQQAFGENTVFPDFGPFVLTDIVDFVEDVEHDHRVAYFQSLLARQPPGLADPDTGGRLCTHLVNRLFEIDRTRIGGVPEVANMVLLLVDLGLDVNTGDRGESLLCRIAKSRMGKTGLDLARALFERGADPNLDAIIAMPKTTALLEAIYNSNFDMAHLLVECGADPGAGPMGMTPLRMLDASLETTPLEDAKLPLYALAKKLVAFGADPDVLPPHRPLRVVLEQAALERLLQAGQGTTPKLRL
jgi:ankyrin repeat protein